MQAGDVRHQACEALRRAARGRERRQLELLGHQGVHGCLQQVRCRMDARVLEVQALKVTGRKESMLRAAQMGHRSIIRFQ